MSSLWHKNAVPMQVLVGKKLANQIIRFIKQDSPAHKYKAKHYNLSL